ncbi:hypothetical protein DV738_g46, partial [Chaetothyriales sp. CBS 135597]
MASKNWHQPKKAFRPTAGLTAYEKRKRLDQEKQAVKAWEQEIKEEAKQERDRKIQAIKDRRKAKEEKERYEKMAEKMHRKLVERRKRREKRNKLEHPRYPVESPAAFRSRSHSTPAHSPSPAHDIDAEAESNTERPDLGPHSHARSQSYVHDGRNTHTEPSTRHTGHSHRRDREKHIRLARQIPHMHLRERVDTRAAGTRTSTDADSRLRLRRAHGHEKTDSLPNLVAGLRKEVERRANADGGYGNGQDAFSNKAPFKTSAKLASSKISASSSSRDPVTGEIIAPDLPGGHVQEKKKSVIEEELERADRLKSQRRFAITAADVAKKDREIEAAEAEMRERLDDVTSRAMDMTRWLDYAYYNLLEKLGHVVDTIHSFETIARQSKQLITHFDYDAQQLDSEMTARIASFTEAFGEREARLARLETQGKELGAKAEELGRRLEQARAAVEEWEEREDKSKQVWSRFWTSILCMSVLAMLILFLATAWKEPGLGVSPNTRPNDTLAVLLGNYRSELGLAAGRPPRIPDDVRTVLEDTQARNRKRNRDAAKPVLVTHETEEALGEAEARLHVLDEL